jgi:prepilin-type N-terminal cleavage/methylation domain-containing protein
MRQRLSRNRSRRLVAEQHGYSLPEVLVAALILAIGIGALLMVFVSAGKGSQTSARQDLAAAIATQELENMRSYPYAALALQQPVTWPDGNGNLGNGATQFQGPKGAEDLVTASNGLPPSFHDPRGYTVYRVISWPTSRAP